MPHPTPTLERDGEVRRRIPRRGDMRVPGLVFASDALLPDLREDESLQQVANVATLPGVVEASYAMPDMHWGYGFPIGGVAATDVHDGGVVSPGGVGFDISCGVRLLAAPLGRDDLTPARLDDLMTQLDRLVVRGLGRGGAWEVDDARRFARLLDGGSAYAVDQGHGNDRDLARCEDQGRVADADTSHVGRRAMERGQGQVGSLGSGNHFLEVQVVDEVTDAEVAAAFGLRPGQVCVMIHSGSRGFGHQICQDHVREMRSAMARYGIRVPDQQLACAPVDSPEGHAYLGAMAAAANYGRANRQLLAERARDGFAAALDTRELDLVYDVSHNLAKVETHVVDGDERELCVHRKGATRALPPGAADLPGDLRTVGQPVLVPGSMGTASHVLVGAATGPAFHSAAHGAGRTMSRHAARKHADGATLRAQLAEQGIDVRPGAERDLPEEAPDAYKDVDEVVAVCERAGLARRVARLVPLGVVKG